MSLVKILRCSLYSRSVMLGCAKRLTYRENIYEHCNLCNHDTSTSRTDRWTDRRTDNGQTVCHSNTMLCVASRYKKLKGMSCSWEVQLNSCSGRTLILKHNIPQLSLCVGAVAASCVGCVAAAGILILIYQSRHKIREHTINT